MRTICTRAAWVTTSFLIALVTAIGPAPGCGSYSPPSSDCVAHSDCPADGGSGDAPVDEALPIDADAAPAVDSRAPADSESADGPSDAPVSCGAQSCTPPLSGHGTAMCTMTDGAPACSLACAMSYHACKGDCLSDSDPPNGDPCVIADAFGTFVAPSGSDTTGKGSQEAPYATIGHALAHATKARVYMCNATYSENVTISSAVAIFGGLACPGSDAGMTAWSYIGGHAQIVGSPNAPAVTVSVSSGAVDLEDLSVSAPDASGLDGTGNGQSSVALLVDNPASSSSVSLHRCALVAGNGASAPTTKPATPTNYTDGATAPSGAANTGPMGGAGGMAACTSGASTGGAGGTAGADAGPGGGEGSSTPTATVAPTGYDGKGGGAGAAGDTGASGAAGAGGLAATAYGTLGSTGWSPSQGKAGASGNPGQGGGGGGAKAAPPTGGTGGGAGGCGGAGGVGGAGGGASIALASVASSVTLDSACTLSTGTAGNGQPGGDGQPGQAGGSSVGGGFSGALGGNGAGGSGGAGGTGGVSVCIAYTGTAPTSTSLCSSTSAGMPGAAGQGKGGGDNADGDPAPMGNPGSTGLAGTTMSPLAVQ